MLINFIENNINLAIICVINIAIISFIISKNPYKKLLSLAVGFITLIVLIMIIANDSNKQEEVTGILLQSLIIICATIFIGVKIINKSNINSDSVDELKVNK